MSTYALHSLGYLPPREAVISGQACYTWPMVGRPFAVFDIDGTLIRWQLYHALADALAREGYLDREAFQTARGKRMAWKKRASNTSFNEYEAALVELINGAMPDIRVADVRRVSRVVLEEYRDQTYTYTRGLIRDLKAQDYLLFAISGSQVELIEPIAEHYGFDDFGGSVFETDGDHFTGNVTLLRGEGKPKYLHQLVTKHQATWEGSIAIGDSEGDIPVLSTVEHPIAFNPTKLLFQHARAHEWRVVLERKNMVYELEPKHGAYVLAQTNA